MKINKFVYLFIVQGNWGAYGWEDETASEDYREARANLREYRCNQPEVPHRMIKRREVNPNYKSN